jgi:histidinol phosphatase-like PHP family hydrolase
MSGAGELLGTQDLHVHTTFSDGRLSLPEVVALAAERGVRVGVADHVSSRTPALMVSTIDGFARYLDALEGAPVWRAAELCWCDSLYATIPAELLSRLDYRIGSNHGFPLPGGGMGSPWWEVLPPPWDRAPERLMDALVDELCRMVRTMPIQIAAHSTLTPPALHALEPDVHAWWTPEREDRYVQALVESGVALEISDRYRLPHDRLLQRARQAGVRFSLGSDGHSRAQVGRLGWATEAARRNGIGDRDLFVPARVW